MKKYIWLLSLGVFLMGYACIEDDSTLPDKPISEITITSEATELNLDFGYPLIIEPQIEQTMPEMELTYEWAYHGYVRSPLGGLIRDSLHLISTEPVFNHSFKQLGQYRIRLKVSNAHCSAFSYYDVNVIAPYNQGIFILSADENKNGRVSFMRPLTNDEIRAGKQEHFYTSAFETVNPDYPLNDPVDAVKIAADLFILSRADKTIYRANSKTFELYNVIDLKEVFPNDVPQAIVSMDRSITDLFVLTEQGNFINVNYNTDIVFDGGPVFRNMPKIDRFYEKILNEPVPPQTSVTNMRSCHYFIDYESSTLYFFFRCLPYNYYTYHTFATQDLIAVVADKTPYTYLVGTSKSNPREVNITRGMIYNNRYCFYPAPSTAKYIAEKDITLTRESIIQSNNPYNWIYYTNGNKVYRWNSRLAQVVLPDEPVITLDPACEITAMNFTADGGQMYIAFVDNRLPGLKGCLYCYDANTIDPATNQLRVYKKYEGIADRPIKVFFKNNREI